LFVQGSKLRLLHEEHVRTAEAMLEKSCMKSLTNANKIKFGNKLAIG